MISAKVLHHPTYSDTILILVFMFRETALKRYYNSVLQQIILISSSNLCILEGQLGVFDVDPCYVDLKNRCFHGESEASIAIY